MSSFDKKSWKNVSLQSNSTHDFLCHIILKIIAILTEHHFKMTQLMKNLSSTASEAHVPPIDN